MIRYWIFIILFCVFSLWFVYSVNAQEMLIAPSIAKESSTKSPSELFWQMGVAHDRENPCDKIKKYTKKYCSINGIKVLLARNPVNELESNIYLRIINSADPCEGIARHIWKVCAQENFKKIIKHFLFIK
jgi:hypothetical protein